MQNMVIAAVSPRFNVDLAGIDYSYTLPKKKEKRIIVLSLFKPKNVPYTRYPFSRPSKKSPIGHQQRKQLVDNRLLGISDRLVESRVGGEEVLSRVRVVLVVSIRAGWFEVCVGRGMR